MSSDNKVALFLWDGKSLTGGIIALGTWSFYVHAAFCSKGTWYHSSEQIGRFDCVDVEAYKNRRCVVYDLPAGADPQAFIRGMKGTCYDWIGIAGWFLNFVTFRRLSFDRDAQFFCFEAAIEYLCRVFGFSCPKKPYSGKTVRAVLEDAGYIGRTGRFGDLL